MTKILIERHRCFTNTFMSPTSVREELGVYLLEGVLLHDAAGALLKHAKRRNDIFAFKNSKFPE